MFVRNPSDYLHIFYDADGGGAGGAGSEGGTTTEPPARTFTQAEVDAMMGRTRSEARTAAANELATDLGVTVDEAKAIIADRNAAEDANKTEAQRDREAAATAKAQADADRAEAARERRSIAAERALLAAGIVLDTDPEKASAALARAVRMIDLDAESFNAVEQANTLKADVPGLFTPTEGSGTRPSPPGGTRPKPPAGGPTTKSAVERGADRWKGLKAG